MANIDTSVFARLKNNADKTSRSYQFCLYKTTSGSSIA